MSSLDYQPLPDGESEVPVGNYQTEFGRVWVRERSPHYEPRYTTKLEGCGWVFPNLVTPSVIVEGFHLRNKERRC